MGKTASGEQEGGGGGGSPLLVAARIPTTTVIHAARSCQSWKKAYNDLKKNKNKDRPKHRMDEEIFKGDLQEIFDPAHSSSLQRVDREGRGQGIPKESERRQRGIIHGWN
ncbi:hypothetical protein GWK47_014920 [Chionoecetes opilio]|uniref:Uncharacterized protein n=1 Tax=Chionoecetes opilio TaxID=41210 RepID=A0A8J4XSE1_CHIOP|nr:hypothetical protein GWK47_014920 [Chionoecetes opilio]